MNKSYVFSFIGGLLGVVLTAYLIVIFTTPKVNLKDENTSGYVNEQTISDIKDKTSSLNSYGNLPVELNATDIGKSDPFSNY